MSDIETVGWTADKRFFILKINMETNLTTDDCEVLAGLFVEKYSLEFSGCQFHGKLAVICGDKVYVNPWALDQEASVDEPVEELSFSEFQTLLNN
ncbi:hypothetical protein M0R57_003687 [Acinetobacter baumannii]|jgi:hypothetical protein|nr:MULTISPECIES: hypothetical protein [Acinetobacter]DAG78010.1 MAG TPA: hypothetical protein [Caudoviricetes sp.]ANB87968.1 hypothetical protein SG90_005485 [Acinetobacter baumannii]ATR87167.1 hypothetical protein CTI08_07645 [Acinetobacter baumannii]AYX91606.1 hypothetical protein EG365_02290 [Acinetobacter sp. FDAARGOS_494]AZP30089.1 hypothetical protein DLK06_13905 [Acinetobacter pittii]